jgi:hypothetical protein
MTDKPVHEQVFENLCDICGVQPAVEVEHDHETNIIRGFACRGCNFLLGVAKDDPNLLMKAMEYLKNPPRSHLGLYKDAVNARTNEWSKSPEQHSKRNSYMRGWKAKKREEKLANYEQGVTACPWCMKIMDDDPEDINIVADGFSHRNCHQREALKRGLMSRGCKVTMTPEVVAECHRQRENGVSAQQLADKYGVSKSTINRGLRAALLAGVI